MVTLSPEQSPRTGGTQISKEGLASRARVARERAGQRRKLARVEAAAAVALIVSTQFAWVNHPRVERETRRPYALVVREVSHTTGLMTWSAGALALVLGALALYSARRLARGAKWAGWEALGLGLAAVGVSVVEFVQLLLGRQTWERRLVPGAVWSPTIHVVGFGLWLAAATSLVLMITACTYLWRTYGSWRDRLASDI